MSLHNNPKYQIPALVDALKQHGLKHNIPSQLADAFRTGWVAALATPAQAAAPDMTDAYSGAREDLSIWKKRALEAEALNRKFAASVNSPSFMGEPAAPAQAALADPMQWPLPCDVKVGHVTIPKGCALNTLVTRMQVLYEMGVDAPERPYDRGFRHGYNRRDAEVKGALL